MRKACNVITIMHYKEKLQAGEEKIRQWRTGFVYIFSLMYHYLLFTILCNLVRFAIPYLKNVFTECHTDAEWQYQSERNLIQLLSLKATAQTSKTNTSHILTSRITEIITLNTGELTMSKAPVQLRSLGPIALQSHLKPVARGFSWQLLLTVSLPTAKNRYFIYQSATCFLMYQFLNNLPKRATFGRHSLPLEEDKRVNL